MTVQPYFKWAALESQYWRLDQSVQIAPVATFGTRALIAVWEFQNDSASRLISSRSIRGLNQNYRQIDVQPDTDSAHYAYINALGTATASFVASPAKPIVSGEKLRYPHYYVALIITMDLTVAGGRAASSMEMQFNDWG